MATLNIGMKVNRAISGATTVNANAYAMVTYSANGSGSLASITTANMIDSCSADVITRYFGPGQSIPASFTTTAYQWSNNARSSFNVTWSLLSGVELINTQ